MVSGVQCNVTGEGTATGKKEVIVKGYNMNHWQKWDSNLSSLNSQPSGLSSTSLGFPAYEEEKSQLGASKMLHLGTENRRGYF